MTLLALALNDAIFVQNDQVRTTSLKVAEAFGKRHDDVLKRLGNLDCSTDFHHRNFAEMMQQVKIGKGATRESKYYEMTKDGFMFLVMGFTGKVAAQIKEAYINAFNAMAAQLNMQPVKQSSTDDRTGLRDAINLLVSKRGLMYPDAYSLIHHRFGVRHLDEMTKTQVIQAIEYVHCTLLDGEFLPRETAQSALSEDDLRHLYGYFSSSMQLIDMYQQLKPMLDVLNSLSLMGLRERIEMLRLCTTHFYDSHGPAILREAKRRGIAQEWLNFQALKDRSLPIILQ